MSKITYPQRKEKLVPGLVTYQTECPKCGEVYEAQLVDGDRRALEEKLQAAEARAEKAELGWGAAEVDCKRTRAELEAEEERAAELERVLEFDRERLTRAIADRDSARSQAGRLASMLDELLKVASGIRNVEWWQSEGEAGEEYRNIRERIRSALSAAPADSNLETRIIRLTNLLRQCLSDEDAANGNDSGALSHETIEAIQAELSAAPADTARVVSPAYLAALEAEHEAGVRRLHLSTTFDPDTPAGHDLEWRDRVAAVEAAKGSER